VPDERERYEILRRKWPRLFENPPGAAYEILFEPAEVREAEETYRSLLEKWGAPASDTRTGVVYSDPWMTIARDAVRRPDGTLGAYGRIIPSRDGSGVAVLPLIDGQVVLLRISRHATREIHLEIPRGFGESGVSAADQARAELHEEIQAKADSLTSLGRLHVDTGATAGATELFFAQISAYGQPQAAEGILGIEVKPPQEVAGLIRDARITDSFTTATFTRAWLHGLLPGLPAL
jgi:ADP-ribose pyrophosphatase